MDTSERRSRARSVSKPARYVDDAQEEQPTTKSKNASEVCRPPLPKQKEKSVKTQPAVFSLLLACSARHTTQRVFGEMR